LYDNDLTFISVAFTQLEIALFSCRTFSF